MKPKLTPGVVISTAVGIATLLVLAMGVDWHYTERFASAEKVDEVEEKVDLTAVRLDQQILKDRLDTINDQIRSIVIKYGENPSRMPPEIKSIYLQLLDDKETLLREWDSITIKK